MRKKSGNLCVHLVYTIIQNYQIILHGFKINICLSISPLPHLRNHYTLSLKSRYISLCCPGIITFRIYPSLAWLFLAPKWEFTRLIFWAHAVSPLRGSLARRSSGRGEVTALNSLRLKNWTWIMTFKLEISIHWSSWSTLIWFSVRRKTVSLITFRTDFVYM